DLTCNGNPQEYTRYHVNPASFKGIHSILLRGVVSGRFLSTVAKPEIVQLNRSRNRDRKKGK
ncbi:MAG: hypothetical protein R3B95_20645, partial [Nitrospirales bacterium]|nr:hypothetical protein [Nitrospirales bacterium]